MPIGQVTDSSQRVISNDTFEPVYSEDPNMSKGGEENNMPKEVIYNNDFTKPEEGEYNNVLCDRISAPVRQPGDWVSVYKPTKPYKIPTFPRKGEEHAILHELGRQMGKLEFKSIPLARKTQKEIEKELKPLSQLQNCVLYQFQQEITRLKSFIENETNRKIPTCRPKEMTILPERIPFLRRIPRDMLNFEKQFYYEPKVKEITDLLKPIAEDIQKTVEELVKFYIDAPWSPNSFLAIHRRISAMRALSA